MSLDAPTEPSLADRITKEEPEPKQSWADEVNSPATEQPPPPSEPAAEMPQSDGAAGVFGGSQLQEPDYQVQVKLADMQADPNNPLYSAKSFEELNLKPEVLKGVTGMNFRKPSKVQERTLPLLLMNPPKNLIGQSQSGTGKTAAFVLNILSRVDISTPEMQRSPQALVLAPSRELARQICGVVRLMGHYMENLLVDAAVPVEAAQRSRKIEASIVVGTPGTVQDLIKRRSMNVSKMRIMVLDEADNMLDQQGMGDQCSRVKAMLPKNIQVVLFSATFPENVVTYAHNFAPQANEMTLRHEDLTVEGIKQIYLDCDNDEAKYDTLVKFYGMLTIGSSIIFVKKKDTAAKLEQRMTAEGHKVVALTSAYEGSQRDVVIDAFRLGHAKVLISTNVLARGIDVSSVSMVVNYDVPDMQTGPRGPAVADPQTYLHRIGRTGRFGRVGVAVSFVSSKADWEKLMEISSYFQTEITRLDTGDWDELEEQVTKIIKSSRAGTNFKGNASGHAA